MNSYKKTKELRHATLLFIYDMSWLPIADSQLIYLQISLKGYAPSMAFDNNPESLWISNGAAPPGMQWIGYEFPHPVFIGSVQIATEEDKPDRLPALMYVEASCEKYFRNFVTQWVIFNPNHSVDKRYSGKFYIIFLEHRSIDCTGNLIFNLSTCIFYRPLDQALFIFSFLFVYSFQYGKVHYSGRHGSTGPQFRRDALPGPGSRGSGHRQQGYPALEGACHWNVHYWGCRGCWGIWQVYFL